TEISRTAGFDVTASVAVPDHVIARIWLFAGEMLVGESETDVIVGPVVSRTVTVNEPVASLPAASVAVQSTVVVPSGNVRGEVIVVAPILHVTATEPSTSSVAEGENDTDTPEA